MSNSISILISSAKGSDGNLMGYENHDKNDNRNDKIIEINHFLLLPFLIYLIRRKILFI
jgi:hypothetical protein